MKSSAAFILTLLCLFGISGCGSKEAFFIAKVLEIGDSTLLVEVTDKGNCGVSVGEQIRFSSEKLGGVLENDSSIVTENYLRVEFNGEIMETYPLKLGEIFSIDITDADGASIE